LSSQIRKHANIGPSPTPIRWHFQTQDTCDNCPDPTPKYNLLAVGRSGRYDSNWPKSSGKVSFTFAGDESLIWVSQSIPIHNPIRFTPRSGFPCTLFLQAAHLHATANGDDAREADGGLHPTHLEARGHALPAAHLQRAEVHQGSGGP